MVWNNKWEILWKDCKVYSTHPYIFRDTEGTIWEAISVEDTIYYQELRETMPKNFWEGQPVVLKRP